MRCWCGSRWWRCAAPRRASPARACSSTTPACWARLAAVGWNGTPHAPRVNCCARAIRPRCRSTMSSWARSSGQCCGGRVQLWLERLTRQDLPWLQTASQSARNGDANAVETRFAAGIVTHRLRSLPDAAPVTLRRDAAGETLVETLGPRRSPLWVFGAGHVGQALVRLLAELALFDIRWIDPRPELLPAGLPDGVTTQACAAPVDLVGAAAPATRYVVLTHDHALDYELCRSILKRGDAAWVGLIGSASKAARFRARLRRDGIDPTGLTCPIGVSGIVSKLPAAIAIAVAAQLLQLGARAPVAGHCGRRRHCVADGARRPRPAPPLRMPATAPARPAGSVATTYERACAATGTRTALGSARHHQALPHRARQRWHRPARRCRRNSCGDRRERRRQEYLDENHLRRHPPGRGQHRMGRPPHRHR